MNIFPPHLQCSPFYSKESYGRISPKKQKKLYIAITVAVSTIVTLCKIEELGLSYSQERVTTKRVTTGQWPVLIPFLWKQKTSKMNDLRCAGRQGRNAPKWCHFQVSAQSLLHFFRLDCVCTDINKRRALFLISFLRHSVALAAQVTGEGHRMTKKPGPHAVRSPLGRGSTVLWQWFSILSCGSCVIVGITGEVPSRQEVYDRPSQSA